MNVLAIGAHYDDIEMGCGGTLIKHRLQGHKITMIVVTESSFKNPNGDTVRDQETAEREGLKAAQIIGAELHCLQMHQFHVFYNEELTGKLLHFIETLNIDTIYSHWTGDVHRDHQNTGLCAIMAGKHVPRFLMYRSNCYDSDQVFRGNFYSDITATMNRKLEAISTHESELRRVNNQWIDFFTRLNRNDGQKAGTQYAECFEIVRYLI